MAYASFHAKLAIHHSSLVIAVARLLVRSRVQIPAREIIINSELSRGEIYVANLKAPL